VRPTREKRASVLQLLKALGSHHMVLQNSDIYKVYTCGRKKFCVAEASLLELKPKYIHTK
jgi:hypothetical protein